MRKPQRPTRRHWFANNITAPHHIHYARSRTRLFVATPLRTFSFKMRDSWALEWRCPPLGVDLGVATPLNGGSLLEEEPLCFFDPATVAERGRWEPFLEARVEDDPLLSARSACLSALISREPRADNGRCFPPPRFLLRVLDRLSRLCEPSMPMPRPPLSRSENPAPTPPPPDVARDEATDDALVLLVLETALEPERRRGAALGVMDVRARWGRGALRRRGRVDWLPLWRGGAGEEVKE